MSTLTGVKADAVRPALAALENEIQNEFREMSKYCTGYEYDISRLTTDLISGHPSYMYFSKKLKASEELETCRLMLEQERGPREKRIEELRAKKLLVENLKTQSLTDIATQIELRVKQQLEDSLKTDSLTDTATIINAHSTAPSTVVTIVDQFLEAGYTIQDLNGKPHYYA